jgi:hypothetical protein
MDASPYLSTVVFPDAESELRDPRLFIAALRRQAREYSEQIPSLRRRLALARMQLAAARQGRRGAHVDRMELHQRVADAKVDLGACRAAITALRSWCRELTGNPSTRATVKSQRFTSHPTTSTDMTNASKPPEGTGYVEKDVADRYASMSNTLPAAVPLSKNPDAMPIGGKAGEPFGYRPSGAVLEAATPRIVNGGGKQ